MKHKGFDRIGREITAEAANRMCIDKKRFNTRNEARDWTLRRTKKYPQDKPCDTYKCSVCGDWHLTTLSKESGAAARRRNWSKT